MGMLPTLKIPAAQPRWATGSGTTTEPLESIKTAGHLVGSRSASRWQNWWQNLVFEWVRGVGAMVVSNWRSNLNQPADDLVAVTYHPEHSKWIATGNSKVYGGQAGSWDGGTALTAAQSSRSVAIDNDDFLIGLTDGSIDYGDPLGGWTNDSGVGGGGSSVDAMETKYPDSNFLVVGLANGTIRIAASGVGGSWVAASTQPSGFTGSVRRIIRTASAAWFAVDVAGNSATSSDDADNWVNTTGDPKDEGLTAVNHAALNEETGVIVCVGAASGPVAKIVRSLDGGASWESATLEIEDIIPGNQLNCVYHAGGGIWVAAGLKGASSGVPTIIVSRDDGATWYPVSYDITGDLAEDINHVGCNGRILYAVGVSGFNARSLSIAGSMLG